MDIPIYRHPVMVIVLAFIVFVVIAAPETLPSCHRIVRARNFNISKYGEGVWYEIGRAGNNHWENRGDCVVVTYTNQDNNIITYKIAIVNKHKVHNVEGSINIDAEAKGTGYIDYHSTEFEGPESSNTVSVEVMAIDYNKYAVVFHCHFDSKENKLHRYIWILSRSPTLDDASMKAVTDVINNAHIFNFDSITWDHFSKDTCYVT